MVKVILHCSDSHFGNASLIAKWHVMERGWNGIGYHFVILNGWVAAGAYHPHFNGHVETGRPLDNDPFIEEQEVGAHVRGHNRQSVGICLIGKSGQFTDEQLNAALPCVHMLEQQFGDIELFQHSHFDAKKAYCAGLNMSQFQSNYQLYKQLLMENDK